LQWKEEENVKTKLPAAGLEPSTRRHNQLFFRKKKQADSHRLVVKVALHNEEYSTVIFK
jgi:hypothetical protein